MGSHGVELNRVELYRVVFRAGSKEMGLSRVRFKGQSLIGQGLRGVELIRWSLRG